MPRLTIHQLRVLANVLRRWYRWRSQWCRRPWQVGEEVWYKTPKVSRNLPVEVTRKREWKARIHYVHTGTSHPLNKGLLTLKLVVGRPPHTREIERPYQHPALVRRVVPDMPARVKEHLMERMGLWRGGRSEAQYYMDWLKARIKVRTIKIGKGRGRKKKNAETATTAAGGPAT